MNSVPGYLQPKEEPAPATSTVKLINDPFYPDVTLQGFQDKYQLDGTFQAPRQEHQLKHAIVLTNEALEEAKAGWQAQGYNTLKAVPSTTLLSTQIALADSYDDMGDYFLELESGEPIDLGTEEQSNFSLLIMYRIAVYTKTLHLLNSKYRATDTTERAVAKAKALAVAADHYADEHRAAIIYLMGEAIEDYKQQATGSLTMAMI